MKRLSLFVIFSLLFISVISDNCIDGICSPNDKLNIIFQPGLQKLQQMEIDNDHFGSFVNPTPFDTCEIVDINEQIFEQFGITSNDFNKEENLQSYLCGEKIPKGGDPFAHRYGGIQFGYWAGELGDGRALSWGLLSKDSDKFSSNGYWDWQLKGSGITPYSRDGDGRAVLRSSIREYLGSWAMYNLGVPTSLCPGIVRNPNPSIIRDPLYNGNFITEQGSITLRIAPSWIRFGNFQLLYKEENYDSLAKLIGYTIDNYFSYILNEGESAMDIFTSKSSIRGKEICKEFLNQVILNTADLIAYWKANAFAHGVMNTDNMSIHGITIDYGPFGFMDNYKPEYTSNYSDDKKRYKFSTQDSVGMWNLKQFSDSLLPFIDIKDQVHLLANYFDRYNSRFLGLMSVKLGFNPEIPSQLDETLITALLELIENVDYHYFFRKLSLHMGNGVIPPKGITNLLTEENANLFKSWWRLLEKRRSITDLSVKEQRTRMLENNPIYVLRNHIAEKAIKDATNGDFSTIKTLKRILASPYTKDSLLTVEEHQYYSSSPDPDAEKVIISCSS